MFLIKSLYFSHDDSPVWSGGTTRCCCSESGTACSTTATTSPGHSPASGCGWATSRASPCQRAGVKTSVPVEVGWSSREIRCCTPPKEPCDVSQSEGTNETFLYSSIFTFALLYIFVLFIYFLISFIPFSKSHRDSVVLLFTVER